MDCFYHNNVPSIARCTGCRRPICASCRDDAGTCSGCRLAERIDAARGQSRLKGSVPRRQPPTSVAVAPPESRALVALGYPFWPLAVLALFDPNRSPYIKRQAWQAIAFNFGTLGLGFALAWLASIPFVGWSAIPLAPLVFPVAFVASCVYGFKAWHGEDVRIPIVTDWVERTTAKSTS